MAESKQTPQYKPDDKSSVYDKPGSAKAVSGSGLFSKESSDDKEEPSSREAASAESLNKAESGGGFYKKSADAAVKVAGKAAAAAGPEAVVAEKSVQKILRMFSRHKSGTAAGGGALIIFIFIGIFGAGFLVSHEIITLEKTFLKYETKIEQHFEKRAANKLMQKMLCLQTQTCKNGTDPDGADKDAATENGDANTTPAADEPLAGEMKDFPLTSEPVASALAAQGIDEVKGPTGALEGLKDASTGADVTNDVATDTDGVADSIEAAEPEFDLGQETSLRTDLVEHAGINEDPSTNADPDDTDQAVQDNVVDGATESEIAGQASITDSGNSGGTADAAAYGEGVAEGGVLGKILGTADADIAQAKPEPEVEKDAEGVDLGDPVFISTVASTVCSIDHSVTNASSSRVPKIDTLLIRHGMLLVSLADELKVGDLSGGALNKVMNLFNGDSSAAPTTDAAGTRPAEASYPLSDSAAYQSASGNSGGIAMDSASLPTKNAGSLVVDSVNSVISKSIVGGLVCKAEGTLFGTIANTLANGAQLFSAVVTGGLSEAASIAANLAVFEEVQHVLVPEILKYFTVEGLDGLEDSAQWGNNAGAGLNLASNDYSRSIGGNPVTTPVASQIASEATQEQNIAESHLSWVNRTVALSNPDSLASHILMDMPVGLAATINGAVSSIVRLPATLLHDFSTIFYSRAIAAAVPSDPGEADGITQYAFTDSEGDQYDPIVNEMYLFTSVTFVDKKDKIDAVIPNRITALGNPNTDLLNAAGDEVDSNNQLITTDLLHCYVDNYADLQEAMPLGQGIDNYCYDPGVYSFGDYDYSADPPADAATVDSALDSTIAQIYCYDLLNHTVSITLTPLCIQSVNPQVKDDIGHFRQYILDVHVMNDYEGLVTNQ